MLLNTWGPLNSWADEDTAFGSGTPWWKFSRLDEGPRRLKLKTNIKRFEVEAPEPAVERIETSRDAQLEIDRLKLMKLDVENQIQALKLMLSSQAVMEQVMLEGPMLTLEVFEILARKDLSSAELFFTALDELIGSMVALRRRRKDEEELIVLISSGMIH